MTEFGFEILARDGLARRGTVMTGRGAIRTPAFMPVGTAGTVKAMYLNQVKDTGADIILGNTYHLMLRPGAERVARLGGLHKLIRWDGPILPDSGGFQVLSLSGPRQLDDQGVTLKSHVDGSQPHLSPERPLAIQGLLCIPPAEDPPSPPFALLPPLADRYRLPILSMRLSPDFSAALQMGAPHVRVGPAIFVARPHKV